MEFTYLLLNVRVNVIKTIHPLDLPWTYPLGRGNRHPPLGVYIYWYKNVPIGEPAAKLMKCSVCGFPGFSAIFHK